MKKCELCKVPARTFCESDQASLCWDCDAKVHAANFLVARHSRTLLCHTCRSPTPWKASGARLGNTVSVCHRCAAQEQQEQEETEESEGGNHHDLDTDDDNDVTADEDGDNQVVPWSSTPSPPAVSSSTSEESVSGCNNGGDGHVSELLTTTTSLKRQRDGDAAASDRDLQEGPNGSASRRKYGGGEWREEVVFDGEPPAKELMAYVNGRASNGV